MFPYITDEKEFLFVLDTDKSFKRKFPIGQVLNLGLENKKAFTFNNFRLLKSKIFYEKLIIKDLIALFSIEWLNQRYSLKTIVLIRHPTAFVSSLKKNNWAFNFNDCLEQQSLMKDVVTEYKSDIHNITKLKSDIVQQGIFFIIILINYRTNIQNGIL